MGDKKKHNGLMNQVVIMNKAELAITKYKALEAEMIPDGISRFAVRGFFLSKSASSQRLNAIAALRANTMQSTTSKSFVQLKECPAQVTARKNPIMAKGMAKI